MNLVSRFFSVGLLAGFLFLQYDATALAQRKDCDKYASDAVAAWKFASENNCGFYGDAWSPGLEAHKVWCLDVSPQDVQRETDVRNGMIRACQNVTNDCVAYAEVAVAQQWANRNWGLHEIYSGRETMNCEGPAWNDDQMAHEHWCLRASPEDRRDETLRRALQLRRGQCSAAGSKAGGLSTQTEVESKLEKGPIEAPGPVDETERNSGPITMPGPIEGTELKKGPLVGN